MTVGIYIRVSTREQVVEGFSIDAQKENLVNYCKSQGWKDYRFYVDEGISAKDTDRPQLQLLMQHIKEKKIDMILVYRLDRFTRSVSDLYQMLDTIDQYGCTFKSATEMYDTSSAMGRMFIGLVALLAQWERENIGERIEVALVERARQLKTIGLAPYGFRIEDEKYVINEEQAPTLRAVLQSIFEGMTINAVSVELNQKGAKPPQSGGRWYPSTLRNILRNPALYGGYYYKGETVEDAFQGYMTKAEWLTLQEKLNGRRRRQVRGQTTDAAFRGVLHCPECGHHLSPAFNRSKKTNEKMSYMYRCSDCRDVRNIHKTYSEKKLIRALLDYMDLLNDMELQELKVDNDRTSSEKDLTLSIEKIKQQRLKFQRIWSEGIMSDDEFYKLMRETDEKLRSMQQEMEKSAPVEENDWELLKEIALSFNRNFTAFTPAERSTFVSSFIKRIDFKIVREAVEGLKRPRESYEITDIRFYS